MPRRPPTSTLFPYTTLFRSHTAQQRQFFSMVTALAETLDKRDPYTGGHVRRVVADRKSTRLNSSHSQISYAVFGLKKKIGATYQMVTVALLEGDQTVERVGP